LLVAGRRRVATRIRRRRVATSEAAWRWRRTTRKSTFF